MKCPCCGAVELIADTRDLLHTYKGVSTTIPAVTAEFCPACGESIADLVESDRIMKAIRAFNEKVNSYIGR